MIRPTRRAVFVFLGALPLSLFLVIDDPRLWTLSFDYGVLVAMAMATDLLLALPRRSLDLAVATPPRIFIGEEAGAAVTIASRHRRPVRIELLCDCSGVLDRPGVVTAAFVPGEETRIVLPLLPRRRGKIRLERLWLRWRGPLGLIELTRIVPLDRSIDVVPNTRGIHSAALNFFAEDALFGLKVQVQRGEGTEFDALRDYAPGLDNRVIDWKHSARHRKLLCKEFKTERNHQIVLAFDTGYLMSEPMDAMPRLDHAINAGLLLAWISLQSGDLVGTFGFDARVRQYFQPMRGVSGFARVQQATAALDYHHDETNFTLGLAELSVRLKRRALVILFTDFVDSVTAELLIESAQRVANRHVVIFVTLRDPYLQRTMETEPRRLEGVAEAVIANDLLRDREIVFERLARLGIQCLDVASDQLSAGLVNRYLMVKQRGLL